MYCRVLKKRQAVLHKTQQATAVPVPEALDQHSPRLVNLVLRSLCLRELFGFTRNTLAWGISRRRERSGVLE